MTEVPPSGPESPASPAQAAPQPGAYAPPVPPPPAYAAPPVQYVAQAGPPVAFGVAPDPSCADISPAKSGTVAALLSVLLTGAGQMYLGRVGRGFAFLGGAIGAALATFWMLGLGGIAIWVWSIVDAYSLAEKSKAYHTAAYQAQVQAGQVPAPAYPPQAVQQLPPPPPAAYPPQAVQQPPQPQPPQAP